MRGSDQKSMWRDGHVACLNKTRLRRQASPKWRAAQFAVCWVLFFGAGLAGCGDHVAEGKDCPQAQRAHTLSGFCVPRYVSLKRGEVYGRKGPGKDYPALWIYHVKGLPVQVVGETADWRRICDPDGGAIWVHRSMVDGKRTVMAVGASPAPMLKQAKLGATAAGFLTPRALAGLDRCAGGWCKVTVGGVSGWLRADQVWGIAALPQCR